MLIAAAREMIAAYQQLKASLRYSRKALLDQGGTTSDAEGAICTAPPRRIL